MITRKLNAFLVLALSLFTLIATGQEVTVIDELTRQAIPEVKIYCADKSTQVRTNNEGQFALSVFSGCDSIYLEYFGYETLGLKLSKLEGVRIIEMEEDALSLNETTVTANRWEKDQVEVPNRITRLNLKKLELLAPQTAADLLETSGYVFVQKSQLAGGSPQLRGFGTNRVLIVVDGVRMNNAIFRSGNLQNVISIDPIALESVEVLFGPGAVMYGSDAIGGVMDFKTKLPRFVSDSSNTITKVNFLSRYSTANNEVTNHLDISLGSKKWAFLTTASHSIFGDLKAGSHGNDQFLRPTFQATLNGTDTTLVNPNPEVQVNSGYSQLNVSQKVSYRPNDKWLFEYGFHYSTTSNAPRYDRLITDKDNDGVLDYAQWYYGPQSWMMNRLGITFTPGKSRFADAININLAQQNFKESRHDRKTDKDEIRRQFESVDAYSLNLDMDKKVNARTELFYGAEAIINSIHSNAYREDIFTGDQQTINPRYPDGSFWGAYGVYGNIKYHLTEKWLVNTGVRYSIYQIKAQFDTTLFPYPITETSTLKSSLNGSIGLIYNPSRSSQMYLNLSTGFRAPNIDDLGKVFDSEPGRVVVPNPDLKPETAYNVEIGFMKALKHTVKLDGAVYYTYLDDALARTFYQLNGQDSIVYEGTLSQVQAVQNVTNAYVYGAQAGIELALPKGISAYSKLSYQEGFEYNLDSARYYPKSHITPLFGRSGVTWTRKKFRLELYVVYQGKMENEDLPLNERSDVVYALDKNNKAFTPGWYTLNLKGAIYFNKYLSMTAGIENITDQLYRTFGSGISAPGRNFIVSLKATL